MTEDQYRLFVQRQRRQALRYVDTKLDGLCQDLGYPRSMWKTWRQRDIIAKIQFSGERFNAALREIQAAMQNQILTPNEIRLKMGLPPIEE